MLQDGHDCSSVFGPFNKQFHKVAELKLIFFADVSLDLDLEFGEHDVDATVEVAEFRRLHLGHLVKDVGDLSL